MASNIFNYKRNPKPAGVLSNEDSQLIIGGITGASAMYLVQQWNIQYSQNVEEIFELGSNRMYWKKGRPQGSGSIARIVGAGTKPGVNSFKDALDICDGGASMQFSVGSGSCTGPSPFTIDLSGIVVVAVAFSSQVSDAQVNEAISYRFSDLKV